MVGYNAAVDGTFSYERHIDTQPLTMRARFLHPYRARSGDRAQIVGMLTIRQGSVMFPGTHVLRTYVSPFCTSIIIVVAKIVSRFGLFLGFSSFFLLGLV